MKEFLFVLGWTLLAGAAAIGAVTLLNRWFATPKPTPREPSDKEPASPVPATTRRRWPALSLRLVPPWRRTREYEGAGDGIEYSRLLHSLVIERDLDPQAPIDPDEQRWAQEFAEVRAHLGEAVEACARGIYRAQLKADKDALTVTGSWTAAARAELDAMLADVTA